ncbi:MAG TPA: BrnT family toxin [Spirochaetia bacterium]|nr:BrnT family toxin [Spirochaetia bacterium]
MRVIGFEWDSGNAGHILARHGLMPDEVEEVFLGIPLIRNLGEDRLAAYGQDGNGRYLTVVCIRKDAGVVRVVTARDMNQWERRYHRREKGV